MVSESVTRSPIELFWTAKKNIARGTTDPEYSKPEFKTDVIFVSIFCFLSQFSLLYIKIHKPLHFSWLFHILLLLVKHMYIYVQKAQKDENIWMHHHFHVSQICRRRGNVLAIYWQNICCIKFEPTASGCQYQYRKCLAVVLGDAIPKLANCKCDSQ